MKVISAIVFVIIISFSFIFYSYLFAGCDVPLEYQKNKLLEHLTKNGLLHEYLTYDEEGSTKCSPSFIYKNKTQHIHYVLVDGGSITSWDYNDQKQ